MQLSQAREPQGVTGSADVGDLSSKSGYDSYTELGNAADNLKIRPGLTNPLWMFIVTA